MGNPTQLQIALEQIMGRDQSKGIEHLSKVLNIEHVLQRGTPLCILVPELGSLTKDSVGKLRDSEKVAISILLGALSPSGSQHGGVSGPGLTWEELQSLLSQAGYLKPAGKNLATSRLVRSKRKIRWFRKLGDPETEPKPGAVYELLLEIALGNQYDSETHSLDLTPLKNLIGPRDGLTHPERPSRGNSTDSSVKYNSTGGRGSSHVHMEVKEAASGTIALNTASSQKYSLGTRSHADWLVLEIISLRFPTPEDPNFTASRLAVNAWTSVDRRLILPRAQTVVRIETFSKVFGARTEFIEGVDVTRRARAIAKTECLFESA